MWPFITNSSQLIILATASIGISILISFIIKVNFAQIQPQSTLANWNEVQYHVVIEQDGGYICSGALVHKKNVITLASRLIDMFTEKPYNTTSLKVIVGVHTLPGAFTYEVEKVTLHPDYQNDIRKDDIAVILLKEEVDTDYWPISYSPKKKISKGHELLVSGYGDVEFSRGSLHKFNMTIFDIVKCRKLVTKHSSKKPLDMSKKFCAVAEHGANHPRTSLGSPATVDREYIVGLYIGQINYNNPGVFIAVTDYVTFIDQQIKSSI